MTLVTAHGQFHLRAARSTHPAQTPGFQPVSRRSLKPPADPRVDDDGIYSLVRRWPAWARLLLIAVLGFAVWTSVILTALPLLP
jgi:hypothetical protein